jgi:hypothetical protein
MLYRTHTFFGFGQTAIAPRIYGFPPRASSDKGKHPMEESH